VQNLTPGTGGVITLTGQVSESLNSISFTNVATITTTVVETDTSNNLALANVSVAQGQLIFICL